MTFATINLPAYGVTTINHLEYEFAEIKNGGIGFAQMDKRLLVADSELVVRQAHHPELVEGNQRPSGYELFQVIFITCYEMDYYEYR